MSTKKPLKRLPNLPNGYRWRIGDIGTQKNAFCTLYLEEKKSFLLVWYRWIEYDYDFIFPEHFDGVWQSIYESSLSLYKQLMEVRRHEIRVW